MSPIRQPEGAAKCRVPVYVPVDDAAARDLNIRPNSAIVGKPSSVAGAALHIYVQDPRPNSNLEVYADRVALAAGRMLEHAPTIAQRDRVPADKLRIIGEYDPREGRVLTLGTAEDMALCQYLGLPETIVALGPELDSTAVRHQQRRSLRRSLRARNHDPEALRALARQWGHEDLLDESPAAGDDAGA